MLRWQAFSGDLAAWGEQLAAYGDRPLAQSPAWLQFVAESQNAEPVLAALHDGSRDVGHFAGLVVRRGGLRILGSPFVGWTTPYMGVRLQPGIDRREAIATLVQFAFEELRCVQFELLDRQLGLDDVAGLGFDHRMLSGFEVDLRPSEGELFGRMTSACRRCIRKAEREGVVVEEAGNEAFAAEYYAQLCDVFAKQGLRPTYDERRVRLLIRHLLPSGMLLLLRARDPAGNPIASGIFPAMNRQMYFWGGASWRHGQHYRPNEAIQWHAMRYWKRRGIVAYDMGGAGDYKQKYGGEAIAVPWLRKSKHAWVGRLRNMAQRTFNARQRLLGRLGRRRFAATGAADD